MEPLDNKWNPPTKRIKIKERDFNIPEFNEYIFFINHNYSVNFLKEICNYYKIKKTGNKSELENRIYKYLKNSHFCIKIQKIYRAYLIRTLHKLKGPAFFNRKCNNDNDFLTFENVKDIENKYFYSIKQKDNIWGFNIISLYNIFTKTPDHLNPYTREVINIEEFDNLKKIIRISKINGEKIDININQENDEISKKKKLELKCLEIFQYINSLGNYSDFNWYHNLSKVNLIRFLRELLDIWMYRAQLTNEIKYEICPPYGNPFRFMDMTRINVLNHYNLYKSGLNIIEQFCKKAIDKENRNLGASYVLCALTIVSPEAADALPWLFQSVSNAL